MKLRKLGKIFDPSDHTLIEDGIGFAQAPQALVFDDKVRILFSTRTRDRSGQYLSHVAFVDFNTELTAVLDTSRHTVLPLGPLGAFDEHGVFPISPIQIDGSIFAYTTGWSRRVSVPVETAIGYVKSDDGGRTFNRPLGHGPIMSAAVQEPFLVGDAFVRKFEDRFHMWYIVGKAWKSLNSSPEIERVYKIAHAESNDGIHWTRDAGRPIVSDAIGADECQALPTVVRLKDAYHMFFCYRDAFGFRSEPRCGYRIGHAISSDLCNWCRDSEPALAGTAGEWDADMQCYPHALTIGKRAALIYNGNEFGRHGFGLAEIEF